MSEPRPLGSALDRLLGGLGPTTSSLVDLHDRWQEIVGEAVAKHSHPVRFVDGHLVVEVDDPRWATQMRFLESTIVSSASRTLGVGIQRVEVRVSKRPPGR